MIVYILRQILTLKLQWAGVCIALEVGLKAESHPGHGTDSYILLKFSIRAVTAGLDMVDGLSHVSKRMEWYMLLHTLLLTGTQLAHDCQQAELRECLRKSIQELYYSLLLYEIQCVCYCYRDNYIIKTLRAFVTLDDWKGKYILIHEHILKDAVEGFLILTFLLR